MRITIFTREPLNEAPHVHVTFGKGDGHIKFKVWLNDDLDVVGRKKDFPGKKLQMALRTIEVNKADLIAEYTRIHGVYTPRPA